MEARYFIAITPPEPIYQEVAQFKTYMRDHYQSKAALRSPPHITLHMPFLWKEKKEMVLLEKLRAFAAHQTPFSIDLHDFGCFEPRVIFMQVTDNDALSSCQQALMRFCRVELNLFNANYRDHPFHPHLTIAFRDLKKQNFPAAWADFAARTWKATWTVKTISLLKHDGTEWKIHHEFPLGSLLAK